MPRKFGAIRYEVGNYTLSELCKALSNWVSFQDMYQHSNTVALSLQHFESTSVFNILGYISSVNTMKEKLTMTTLLSIVYKYALMHTLHIHSMLSAHTRTQTHTHTHTVHYTPVAAMYDISWAPWCMPCALQSSDGEEPLLNIPHFLRERS